MAAMTEEERKRRVEQAQMGPSEMAVRFPNGYQSKEPVRSPEEQAQYMANIQAKLDTIKQQSQVPQNTGANGYLFNGQQPTVIDNNSVPTPQPKPVQQTVTQPVTQTQPQQQGYTGNDPVERARYNAGWWANGYRPEDTSKPNSVTPETQLQQAAPFIRSMAGLGYDPKRQQQAETSTQAPVQYKPETNVYSQQGNPLSRAELQAMGRQRDIDGLIMAARGTGDPSRDMIYQKNAQDVLRTLGGYHGAPLASEIQKDMATANKINVESSLAPGQASASNAAHYAAANAGNANASKTAVEARMYPDVARSDIGYKESLAKAALMKDPESATRVAAINAAGRIAAADPMNPNAYQNAYNQAMGGGGQGREPSVAELKKLKAERDKKLKAAQGK